MWPLVEHDYTPRSTTDKLEVIKIMGQTVNGVLDLKYHLTALIPNSFSEVLTISHNAIERLEELDREIFKVAVNGQILVMKTVHRNWS